MDPYAVCDRCGIEYHSSELVMQLGLLVCTATCFDDLSIMKRDRLIQQKLSDGANEGGSWRDFRTFTEDIENDLVF